MNANSLYNSPIAAKGEWRRRNYGGIDATSRGAADTQPYGRDNEIFGGIACRRGAGRIVRAGHRWMKQDQKSRPADLALKVGAEEPVQAEITKARIENLRRMHKAQSDRGPGAFAFLHVEVVRGLLRRLADKFQSGATTPSSPVHKHQR